MPELKDDYLLYLRLNTYFNIDEIDIDIDKENIMLTIIYSFKFKQKDFKNVLDLTEDITKEKFSHKVKYKLNDFQKSNYDSLKNIFQEIDFKKYFVSETNYIDLNLIEKYIYNIALIEGINYYKLISPKEFCIPIKISEEQNKFYQKIYYYGLGEYRYVNNIIDIEEENNFSKFIDFIYIKDLNNSKITSNINKDDLNTNKDDFNKEYNKYDAKNILNKKEIKEALEELINISIENLKNEKILIPIGGGKDSLVSMRILKDIDTYKIPVYLAERKERIEQIKYFGFNKEEAFVFSRYFDKNIIKYNKLGYLNGHIPFSAVLGFHLVFIAYVNNIKYIALSNESSANEANFKYNINHQYSKTLEFEKDFISYNLEYLSKEILYFSLLRGLNEVQIIKELVQDNNLISLFKSCNEGSKQSPWIWCENCPKCLFVYIMLLPFLSKEDEFNIKNIFNSDILDNIELKEIFLELQDRSKTKPFECVGTYDEIKYSLVKVINNMKTKSGKVLPRLLQMYVDKGYYEQDKKYLEKIKFKPLQQYENKNFIPKVLNTYIKKIYNIIEE